MIEDFNDSSEALDMRLKSWSHSRLVVFEQCKRHAQLQYIDKIPEPIRPLPPGKTEHANDRGTRLHTAAELFTKGGVELLPELQSFETEHHVMRDLYAKGMVSLEGEWAFNRDWESTAWMSHDTWCRIKCDGVVFMDPSYAIVVDYKSGKRFGNEVKHAEQMQLYQIATFLKYPDVEKVRVELWYWDQDELWGQDYTRAQGLRFMKNFDTRGAALTTCEEFPPNPNVFSCRWCPYKPSEKGGTGHCPDGV